MGLLVLFDKAFHLPLEIIGHLHLATTDTGYYPFFAYQYNRAWFNPLTPCTPHPGNYFALGERSNSHCIAV